MKTCYCCMKDLWIFIYYGRQGAQAPFIKSFHFVTEALVNSLKVIFMNSNEDLGEYSIIFLHHNVLFFH